MIRRIAAAATIALTLVGGACLDSTNPPDATPIEQTNFASSLGVDLNASTKTPNGAYYRDITVGSGAVAANGQNLTVFYTGFLSGGQQFETNVNGTPFPFVLGTGNVIEGWHETIPGMRVGGRRQVIIPAYLAYGPFGSGPIPGNAVIVFTIELVSAS